jgi:membrane protein implicated in regulation of membrane protease activity
MDREKKLTIFVFLAVLVYCLFTLLCFSTTWNWKMDVIFLIYVSIIAFLVWKAVKRKKKP